MIFINRDDILFKLIVEVMEKKFKKYWSEIPLLYSFTFVLDPRVKLLGLHKCFAHNGTCMNLDLSIQYSNINNKLFEVYAIYENKFGNLKNQPIQ